MSSYYFEFWSVIGPFLRNGRNWSRSKRFADSKHAIAVEQAFIKKHGVHPEDCSVFASEKQPGFWTKDEKKRHSAYPKSQRVKERRGQ